MSDNLDMTPQLTLTPETQTAAAPAEEGKKGQGPILVERKNILVNCEPEEPEAIIRKVGRMMVESGYADEGYIEGMVQRDKQLSVAIGCHVAIPHGIDEARKFVRKTGLVVLTYPKGVAWGDDTVKLVIGIAAVGEEHMDVLGVIADIAGSDEDTDALVASADAETIYRKLNGLE